VWICGLVLAGVVAVLGILLATHWPFTQAEITRALEQATGRAVVIRTFRKTYMPPGCVAEDIRVLHRSAPDAPPLIQIQQLSIRGSYAGLFRSPKHISEVKVRAMHLQVPPKSKDGQGSGGFPLFEGGGVKSLVIDRIVAESALLEFMPDEPGKTPYRIDVRSLILSGVGSDSPWTYKVALWNMEPPGEIRAEGKFGPMKAGDAGATPVSGKFEYVDAKLGIFKGIEGTLAGKGEFSGPLARIETRGTTSVPDFHVTGSSHRVKLQTDFQATVNGTNGDVKLSPVTTHFLKSSVVVQGQIANEANLDVSVPHGRVEDLLLLFVDSPQAPMTGRVDFHTSVRVPGGDEPFLRKLGMDGGFGIGAGRFTSPQTQDSIDRLSQSAQGESKKQEDEDPSTALSDLRGHVSVKGGVARFSHVSFSFTGASAVLGGTWGLIDHRFDLRGTLETRGRLSDTTSGFKAVVLKALSAFLKKHHSAKIVPFRIKGLSSDPVITLDWGRAVSGK
jgi:hypothetical protein